MDERSRPPAEALAIQCRNPCTRQERDAWRNLPANRRRTFYDPVTVARPGDALENPLTGERLVFRHTTADSNGALVAFDYFLPVGGSVPLAHVHPRQDERFEIVTGTAKIRVGRRGFPHPLQMAVMAKEYRNEGRFPFVPGAVQLALIMPLAALGTRLGYRPFDPRYGSRIPATR